jgi:hypothetical protein
MTRRLLLVPALCIVLSACGGASDPGAASTSSSPSDAPAPSQQASPTAPTSTTQAEPVTTEQDCPYLATSTVEDVVGQKTPTVSTTGTPGGPPPSCTFAKPNGEAALTVEISQVADSVAARTAAVERVAGIGGTAVTDIADGGGIAVGQPTVLAVAHGTLVVVVTINQQSSLQAREIAKAVVGAV